MEDEDNPFRRPENFTFSVLNGPTFALRDRPPLWQNATALLPSAYEEANPPDIDSLPLQTFPLIDDFEIRLETMLDKSGQSLMGYHVVFFSPALGYLASFPWWDHADAALARADFSIPLGNAESLYYDLEQSWEIVIAARDDFVYILEGKFDAREVDGYEVWFKVLKDRYLDQWRNAILACKQALEST
jgi:hypothetical protein